MVAQAKDAEPKNTTGTDLEILKNLEKAFYRNNPTSMKRNIASSLEWFKAYVGRSYNKLGTGSMFRDRSLWAKKLTPGKMYFFEYDAKHKATLPIWDRYPMMFPISSYKAKDGMEIVIGLNMHYLSPSMRMIAFKALLKLRTESRYRKGTKLALEWELLKNLGEADMFKHSIHSYRMDHVKSVFVEVPSQSWEMALFLPLARFQKGSNSDAYKLKK